MNWNNSIKNLDLKLVASLGPEMGFLSFFIGILWPDDAVDPWDVVRERTEKLINQKIENEVYSRLKQTIAGLGGGSKHRLSVLGLYTDTLHEHIAPSKRYTQFQIANAQFVHDMPQFQEERQERVLLPLFMQCANMHLVLMNHALKLDSEILGLEPDDRLEIQKNLDASIDDYTIYAKKIIATGPPIEGVDPTTQYQQNMMIDVGDYLTLWPYLKSDSKKPPVMPLPREVFSPKCGVLNAVSPNNEPRGDGYFPKPPNKKPIRVRVWGGGRLGAFEVWYEGDDTSKPGERRGGNEPSEPQIDVDLTKRHIEEMTVTLGEGGHAPLEADFVQGLAFRLDDGTTQQAGTSNDQPWRADRGTLVFQVPEDHYPSSFNVISLFHDKSRGILHNDLVRTVYFGFKLRDDEFK